ncbi:hypothetical protein B0H13DRAFT_2332140 [Mycena leptocephala]|nr:hypothetical protein B0H13DRAFT_2332140 [Mycena leptocephala]
MSLRAAYPASLFGRDDIADVAANLSNQCWANNDSASATCCSKLGGTRVSVKGSDIQGCTFHDADKWKSCINDQTGGNNAQACSSSGSGGSGGSGSGGQGNGAGSPKAVAGGGMLLVALLFGRILATFFLV